MVSNWSKLPKNQASVKKKPPESGRLFDGFPLAGADWSQFRKLMLAICCKIYENGIYEHKLVSDIVMADNEGNFYERP